MVSSVYKKTNLLANVMKKLVSDRLSQGFGPRDSWLAEMRGAYSGETCIVFGNGPSLSEFPFEAIGDIPTFGTNGIYLKITPSFYVTISKQFFINHVDQIKALTCERKFIGDLLAAQLASQGDSILRCSWPSYGNFFGFEVPVPFGFSKAPDRLVYLGGTVLFVCLQLAYYLGFSRVVLAGVDHRFGFSRSEAVYGGRHLKVEGPDSIHFDPSYNPAGHIAHCDMLATERAFEIAYQVFRSDDREIWNATPDSGLDAIPKRTLEELF